MSSLSSLLTRKNRPTWSDPRHWRDLCPNLTISDPEGGDVDGDGAKKAASAAAPAPPPAPPPPPPPAPPPPTNSNVSNSEESSRRRERLIEDGYALVDDVCVGCDSRGGRAEYDRLVRALADSILSLHTSRSYPAVFVLLYDEAWALARYASRTLSSSTHPSNSFNFDVLAFCVDPESRGAGFGPHRDRQPDGDVGVASSFHGDGAAKYATLWVALTDATPENSCLYLIPRMYDPGYDGGDDVDDEEDDEEDGDGGGGGGGGDERRGEGGGGCDPMSRALSTKESYQNIRAVPRLAGQAVLFTHRIMHWGSRGNPLQSDPPPRPRAAISFVTSDPTFEAPYVDTSYLTEGSIPPPFRVRLLLVCSQLLAYRERFDLTRECAAACYGYVREYGGMLDESYRRKVVMEFVGAVRGAGDGGDGVGGGVKGGIAADGGVDGEGGRSGGGGGGGKGGDRDDDDDDDDDDDEEEAVLEEMLEAEAGGYGEFRDDYDDVDGGDVDGGDRGAEEDEDGDAAGGDDFDDDDDDDEGEGDGKCLLFGGGDDCDGRDRTDARRGKKRKGR